MGGGRGCRSPLRSVPTPKVSGGFGATSPAPTSTNTAPHRGHTAPKPPQPCPMWGHTPPPQTPYPCPTGCARPKPCPMGWIRRQPHALRVPSTHSPPPPSFPSVAVGWLRGYGAGMGSRQRTLTAYSLLVMRLTQDCTRAWAPSPSTSSCSWYTSGGRAGGSP